MAEIGLIVGDELFNSAHEKWADVVDCPGQPCRKNLHFVSPEAMREWQEKMGIPFDPHGEYHITLMAN